LHSHRKSNSSSKIKYIDDEVQKPYCTNALSKYMVQMEWRKISNAW